MKRRFLAAAAFVIPVVCGIVVHGQAFYPPNTPKFPQARTWLVQKAKLPIHLAEILLTPTTDLVTLVKKSMEIAAADAGEAQ